MKTHILEQYIIRATKWRQRRMASVSRIGENYKVNLLHGQVDELFEVFLEVACLEPSRTAVLVPFQSSLFQLSKIHRRIVSKYVRK